MPRPNEFPDPARPVRVQRTVEPATSHKWSRTLAGCLLLAVGILAALLAHSYLEGRRSSPWLLYALSAVCVLLGSGSVAQAAGMRKLAVALLVATLALASGVALWLALGDGLAQCERSIAGIPVGRPRFVCGSAFAALAFGGAFVALAVLSGALKGKRAS